MSAPQIPVWTWRDAVRQSGVPPLTKLVCYSIANYLADVGAGCFPSVKTLMADTGLSNKSIAAHLAHAQEAGLLIIERRTGRDGRRQLTHYLPRFPSNATLAKRPAAMRDPHAGDEDEFDAENHVNAPHVDGDGDHDHVKELHAARPSEAPSRGPSELVHVNVAPRELSTREPSIPPKSPTAARRGTSSGKFGDEAGKGSGETGYDQQLAALRAEGRHHDAIEHLVAPLVASGKRLSLGRGAEARAALAEIAAKAHGLPSPALAAAVRRIVDRPSKATMAVILAEVETARKFGEALTIRAGSAEWAAWQRHFEASDPQQARAMRSSSVWMVRNQWPASAVPRSGVENQHTAGAA